jgi:hypothetical protein
MPSPSVLHVEMAMKAIHGVISQIVGYHFMALLQS